MKLIIGGRGSGQAQFAREHFPDMEIIEDVHQIVREALLGGRSEDEILGELLSHEAAVFTSDEIGSGIVPIEPFESAWRESTGRILTELARPSDEVYRMICGIGQKLK